MCDTQIDFCHSPCVTARRPRQLQSILTTGDWGGGGVIAKDYHGYCETVKIDGIVVGQQLSELEHKLLDMSINLL